MDDKPPYESKLVAPTWLSAASQVRPTVSPSPPPPPSSSAPSNNHPHPFISDPDPHRKWCGCEPSSHCPHFNGFLHLQSSSTSSAPSSLPPPDQSASSAWLTSAAIAMASAKASASADMAGAPPSSAVSAMNSGPKLLPSPSSRLLDLHHGDVVNNNSRGDLAEGEAAAAAAAGGGGGGHGPAQNSASGTVDHRQAAASAASHQDQSMWSARLKADISMHPLYSQLLAAHVACLRIATPVDQLPRIDAQIEQAAQIISKYEVLGPNNMLIGEEKEELDQFMAHYVLLLCTFKEQLQQHVRVHAMEAVMACCELEQSLFTLTGVSPGEGTGATMSDDEDDLGDGDPLIYDAVIDGHDSGAFGPLIPTETERTLMERVRQELKSELKNGYKDRIVDVREEILRKRRAGKLPGDTTSVLKAWWHAHSKWPYPTEDEKARLVQETGLQLKQINNWFINQRKRNWHSNPSSTAAHKSKRKR